jgi:hypothetical protein
MCFMLVLCFANVAIRVVLATLIISSHLYDHNQLSDCFGGHTWRAKADEGIGIQGQ